MTDPRGGRLNVLTDAGNVAGVGAGDSTNYYGVFVLSAIANYAVVSTPVRCHREFGTNIPLAL